MNVEELKPICDLTVALTEIRAREVPHLCVENFAPELFAKLCAAYAHPERAAEIYGNLPESFAGSVVQYGKIEK